MDVLNVTLCIVGISKWINNDMSGSHLEEHRLKLILPAEALVVSSVWLAG